MMTKTAVAVFVLAAMINAALEISGVSVRDVRQSIGWGLTQ